MKLKIKKSQILKEMKELSTIVASKNTMPILSNFLIEANKEENKLIITTTDLEVTTIKSVDCEIEESGKTCVNAKRLSTIISTLRNEDITFNLNKAGDKIQIKQGRTKFDVICVDAENYPIVPEYQKENEILINGNDLKNMVRSVAFCVSVDTNRPLFMGIYWNINKDGQIMASTDGKRIAESILKDNQEKITEDIKLVVPVKGLVFMEKYIESGNDVFLSVLNSQRIQLKFGNTIMYINTLEGKYPDYTRVFTQLSEIKKVIVEKKKLTESISRVSLLSNDDTARVKFEINENEFVVSAKSTDTGEATDIIDEYTNNDRIEKELALNHKYANQIFKAIETPDIVINISEKSGTPIVIENLNSEGNYQNRYLMMPLISG